VQLFDAGQLKELSREPNMADAMSANVLCVDLRDQSFKDDEVQLLRQWLIRQPVPTVGVQEKESSLTEGLDLVFHNEADCEEIVGIIDQYPKASAVLVQVTRVTETLPVASALSMESLAYATLQAGEEFACWLATYKQSKKVGNDVELSDPVLLEREGALLRITLNTPQNRNALSVPMRDGLSEAFNMVAMDASIEKVIVSGVGPCFSAGGDLTEFGEATDLAEAHRIRQLRMPAQYLAPHADKYTVTVHGACIGAGIEMSAFAGRIYATSDAFFQLPEVAMGLIPGAGGCVSIPRRIGRHKANLLAISGRKLSAQDALSWGLIDEVVD